MPEDAGVLADLAALAPGRLALVGGAVRDALLGLAPDDLDAVLEGGSVADLAAAAKLPYSYHPRYDNATLSLPGGRSLDLVRARGETYPVPGGAPEVFPADLDTDLARRDFSVNALAWLPGQDELLDPHGGLIDLHARTLRPLHAGSFRDDPSRLARGARLAARLGFDLHGEGLLQVPDALRYAPDTPRLASELALTFRERAPGAALGTLASWGAGGLFGADAAEVLSRLDALKEAGAEVSPTLYAAAWLGVQPDPAAAARRFGLGDRALRLLTRAQGGAQFPNNAPETLLRLALDRAGPEARLTGRDVLALGLPPGQAVGAALAHLAHLRAAGAVRTLEDERRALEGFLAAYCPEPCSDP